MFCEFTFSLHNHTNTTVVTVVVIVVVVNVVSVDAVLTRLTCSCVRDAGCSRVLEDDSESSSAGIGTELPSGRKDEIVERIKKRTNEIRSFLFLSFAAFRLELKIRIDIFHEPTQFVILLTARLCSESGICVPC